MLTPHGLPRTLKGAGGMRLIDMPGIIYPENVLRPRQGIASNGAKVCHVPPKSGISSRQAAAMLGITVRAARAMLNRWHVKNWLVEQDGQSSCLYWDRRVVEQMINRRMPLVNTVPEKYCSSKEACFILLISRSTLGRYVSQGLLKEYQFRRVSQIGVRLGAFYRRADVRRLAAHRNAARMRAEMAKTERLKRHLLESGVAVDAAREPTNS